MTQITLINTPPDYFNVLTSETYLRTFTRDLNWLERSKRSLKRREPQNSQENHHDHY